MKTTGKGFEALHHHPLAGQASVETTSGHNEMTVVFDNLFEGATLRPWREIHPILIDKLLMLGFDKEFIERSLESAQLQDSLEAGDMYMLHNFLKEMTDASPVHKRGTTVHVSVREPAPVSEKQVLPTEETHAIEGEEHIRAYKEQYETEMEEAVEEVVRLAAESGIELDFHGGAILRIPKDRLEGLGSFFDYYYKLRKELKNVISDFEVQPAEQQRIDTKRAHMLRALEVVRHAVADKRGIEEKHEDSTHADKTKDTYTNGQSMFESPKVAQSMEPIAQMKKRALSLRAESGGFKDKASIQKDLRDYFVTLGYSRNAASAAINKIYNEDSGGRNREEVVKDFVENMEREIQKQSKQKTQSSVVLRRQPEQEEFYTQEDGEKPRTTTTAHTLQPEQEQQSTQPRSVSLEGDRIAVVDPKNETTESVIRNELWEFMNSGRKTYGEIREFILRKLEEAGQSKKQAERIFDAARFSFIDQNTSYETTPEAFTALSEDEYAQRRSRFNHLYNTMWQGINADVPVSKATETPVSFPITPETEENSEGRKKSEQESIAPASVESPHTEEEARYLWREHITAENPDSAYRRSLEDTIDRLATYLQSHVREGAELPFGQRYTVFTSVANEIKQLLAEGRIEAQDDTLHGMYGIEEKGGVTLTYTPEQKARIREKVQELEALANEIKEDYLVVPLEKTEKAVTYQAEETVAGIDEITTAEKPVPFETSARHEGASEGEIERQRNAWASFLNRPSTEQLTIAAREWKEARQAYQKSRGVLRRIVGLSGGEAQAARKVEMEAKRRLFEELVYDSGSIGSAETQKRSERLMPALAKGLLIEPARQEVQAQERVTLSPRVQAALAETKEVLQQMGKNKKRLGLGVGLIAVLGASVGGQKVNWLEDIAGSNMDHVRIGDASDPERMPTDISPEELNQAQRIYNTIPPIESLLEQIERNETPLITIPSETYPSVWDREHITLPDFDIQNALGPNEYNPPQAENRSTDFAEGTERSSAIVHSPVVSQAEPTVAASDAAYIATDDPRSNRPFDSWNEGNRGEHISDENVQEHTSESSSEETYIATDDPRSGRPFAEWNSRNAAETVPQVTLEDVLSTSNAESLIHEGDNVYAVEYHPEGQQIPNRNNSYWNIMEGETRAGRLPVLDLVAPEHVQRLIYETVQLLEAHPEIAKQFGFKEGSVWQTTNNQLNTDALSRFAELVATERGWLR